MVLPIYLKIQMILSMGKRYSTATAFRRAPPLPIGLKDDTPRSALHEGGASLGASKYCTESEK